METISRHLKGVFASGDISDPSANVSREHCLTLQHYHFDCQRQRNDNGMPYGRILPTSIIVAVKVINNEDCREFYRWLVDREMHDFSIMFNATYNAYQYLADWDAALVAKGYLVDIEEEFNSWNGKNSEHQQMTLTLELLLSEIKFLGESGDKILDIIH